MLLTLLWILPNGTYANLAHDHIHLARYYRSALIELQLMPALLEAANHYTNLANYYRSALIGLQLMPALLEAACSIHEEVQIEVRQIACDYIAPDYIASDYIAFDYT